MIPQGVFLPRTLLPFTWYSLSLPTTAKGMLSCWMAETQANTHAQSSSSPHRTSQGRTAFHNFLCCSFSDAPGGKVKTLPLEKTELGLSDYTVVWLVSLRKLAFLQPESTLYGSLCLSTVSLDLEPLCELARTDSHKQHPHPPAPGASQTPRCVMWLPWNPLADAQVLNSQGSRLLCSIRTSTRMYLPGVCYCHPINESCIA